MPRYTYWKKINARKYEHIPTGNTIQIYNEPEMDYQGTKCYLVSVWIKIDEEPEANHFNVEYTNGYQDALIIFKEFMDKNDTEKFDYAKLHKEGYIDPGMDDQLWDLIKSTPKLFKCGNCGKSVTEDKYVQFDQNEDGLCAECHTSIYDDWDKVFS